MGAGSRQRGDMVIRQRITDESTEIIGIQRGHLNGLYSQLERNDAASKASDIRAKKAEEELRRATALIARLRAENEVLKNEKRRIIGVVDATKRHISIAGNSKAKYAISLVKSRIENEWLL